MEIERKFLVRDATLRDVPGLQLIEIESIYLDLDKLDEAGEALGHLGFRESLDPKEIRVSKHVTDTSSRYWLTTKVGGASISRAESMSELDEKTYLKVVKNFGLSVVNKKRFKFDYLRKTFELDVFPDAKIMMLEIELDKEDQLFALPPFVNIVREVTGDERYYNSNIAEPLVLQTQTS